MRAKYIEIVEIVKARIANGYYLANEFPGERSLAEELGVSYMTARKAIQKLCEINELYRQENGRISVKELKPTRNNLQVALVFPAFMSASFNKWLLALKNVVSAKNGSIQLLPYLNWDDPVIWDAINDKFDFICLIPPAKIPKLLEERLVLNRDRIVTLFENLTHLGISGVDGGDPENIGKVMDHLADQGHKSIDCLNTQATSAKINQHITIWKRILKAKQLCGSLHDYPTAPFSSPDVQARNIVSTLIKEKALKSTALYCVTVAAAKGAMRALNDHNIKIGRDIAVCSFAGGEEAKMLIPSLTVVDTPEPTPILTEVIKTLSQRKKGAKPIFFQPTDAELFIGESTRA